MHKPAGNMAWRSFMVKCQNTQKSTHPQFARLVRCSAHGRPLQGYGTKKQSHCNDSLYLTYKIYIYIYIHNYIQ